MPTPSPLPGGGGGGFVRAVVFEGGGLGGLGGRG